MSGSYEWQQQQKRLAQQNGGRMSPQFQPQQFQMPQQQMQRNPYMQMGGMQRQQMASPGQQFGGGQQMGRTYNPQQMQMQQMQMQQQMQQPAWARNSAVAGQRQQMQPQPMQRPQMQQPSWAANSAVARTSPAPRGLLSGQPGFDYGAFNRTYGPQQQQQRAQPTMQDLMQQKAMRRVINR